MHRLERKGWVASKWEVAKDRNREFKYYRLTPAGKKQLIAEESKWKPYPRVLMNHGKALRQDAIGPLSSMAGAGVLLAHGYEEGVVVRVPLGQRKDLLSHRRIGFPSQEARKNAIDLLIDGAGGVQPLRHSNPEVLRRRRRELLHFVACGGAAEDIKI